MDEKHSLREPAPESTDISKQGSKPQTPTEENGGMFGNPIEGEVTNLSRADLEKQKTAEGEAHFNRLGWKRLTVVLIVEAIALGSLSLPSAFAALGMVAGTLCSVGLGLLAIYTSDIVGKVKIMFPEAAHYADAGRLVGDRLTGNKLWGRIGYELVGGMFALQLILLVGSHCLTGTIAWNNITEHATCSVVFGVVSAIILLALAVPPSFAEVAILGYIDFVSIVLAIGITIVATGIQASKQEGGLSAVPWSAWPKKDIKFYEAFLAITNIIFAYSFSICQFSFMDEMHTPKDYKKSIWALGLIEIFIYTFTGGIVYAFVGPDVKSPALLSAGDTVSKIAFGVGLPVIFISGSINTVVVGRFIHGRVFKNSIIKYINTPAGWGTWLGLITAITIIAFVIAESIPFFSDLLGISSALFISGFTFYFPSIMWWVLIKEGPWYARHNWSASALNLLAFVIGLTTLGCGLYASVVDINNQFASNSLRSAFTCSEI